MTKNWWTRDLQLIRGFQQPLSLKSVEERTHLARCVSGWIVESGEHLGDHLFAILPGWANDFPDQVTGKLELKDRAERQGRPTCRPSLTERPLVTV